MEMEMEMEMGMDSLSFYQHLNPPPPSSGGQTSSYYYHHPPHTATAAMANNNRRDGDLSLPPPPPARQRQRGKWKDRHTKIFTAGGMRDRRMRLSLGVARRFFFLQEKLGFDRASKTVQWLLDMSTAGINHLLATSATSMSLSEDGSGSALLDSNDHVMLADAETNNSKMPTKGTRRAGTKSSNGAPALLPDKESRARARQRARERTVEKNRLRSSVSTVTVEAPAPAPAPAPAGQVILPVFPSFGSYCGEPEPWELGGVVFAKPRHH